MIVLVTDGEDHDSYPVEMAKQANELGIPIIGIGFGSESGSQIMITDSQTGAKSALQDREGNIVISKLDGELLREIALQTEGAYVPAGTAAIDLESIVGEHIKPILTSEKSTNKVQPKEHYMPLILLSLAMLLLSISMGKNWSWNHEFRIAIVSLVQWMNPPPESSHNEGTALLVSSEEAETNQQAIEKLLESRDKAKSDSELRQHTLST